MRPKKDPNIRRETFIEAATGLFFKNGYAGVSINSVLEAVGDRSSSPSVFYYYFSNKDELYHAVIESIAQTYVTGFEKAFAGSDVSPGSRITALIRTMISSLAENRNLSYAGLSSANMSFILDVKEQVTLSLAKMWEQFLTENDLCTEKDPKSVSLFICGGIAEMIMHYFQQGDRSERQEMQLVREMILFAASVLGFSDEEKLKIAATQQRMKG